MHPAFLLISVLPVVFGRASTPTPCCIGDQFSTSIDETGGQVAPGTTGSKFIDQQIFLQFDYTNKRTYVEGTVTLPTGTYPYKVVNDYKANVTYSFTNGVCYTVGAPSFPLQDPCQLSHATYVGTSLMGSPGHHIAVNTFQLDLGGISVKAVLSADGSCIPIMESLVGVIGGAPEQLTIFFSNFTKGLTKPEVFTFDQSTCGPAPTTAAPGS
ncbi:uncharacterized protein LOC133175018 [Saccostrea echinata]|uniref:uncharacterized protein LOC133175018 n=1 Tax=Saccostrea echinata TaxID=191078 RepID=UPI002A82D1E7|nr:uncharacterized protein LOC133175018 [Saccostrea echinata]